VKRFRDRWPDIVVGLAVVAQLAQLLELASQALEMHRKKRRTTGFGRELDE
jgi:hypothetical protein